MILDSSGRPFDLKRNPLAPVPIEAPHKMEVNRTSNLVQAVTEKFSTSRGKELSLKAGYILTRAYPNYGWSVRHIGNANDPSSILIVLADLYRWGGTSTGMYIHPTDWDIELKFEAKVKLYGGELLERARLLRSGKSNDQHADQVPDGFADIMPQKKKKYVEAKSVDHFVQLVNQHIKSINKTGSDEVDGRDNI